MHQWVRTDPRLASGMDVRPILDGAKRYPVTLRTLRWPRGWLGERIRTTSFYQRRQRLPPASRYPQAPVSGRRHIWRVAVAIGLVSILLSYGYAYSVPDPAPNYIATPVTRGSIVTLVKATGTVNAVITVEVSSQLSGRIADVFVNFNDKVKVGQPIARVDPETYIAQVNQATANLKIAESTVQLEKASIERARARLGLARISRPVSEAQLMAVRARLGDLERQLQRKLTLAERAIASQAELTSIRAQRDAEAANEAGALAQIGVRNQEIDIAEADLRMGEASLQNAEAVVEQRRAALDQAQVDLQRTEIRAPIDGVVIKRAINRGQTIAVSLDAKTLFTIVNDLSEMQVDGKIDEADVGRVKVGQTVTFTVDSFPEKMFSGQVQQVRMSPEVAQTVVTYTAVISAPNPDHMLFPGMTADLQITVDEAKDILKIPKKALSFRPPGKFTVGREGVGSGGDPAIVWVLGDDRKPLPVRVRVGKSDDAATEVFSEKLAEGRPVIVGVAAPAISPWPFDFRWR
jgi:HlyD family secretion protein